MRYLKELICPILSKEKKKEFLEKLKVWAEQ